MGTDYSYLITTSTRCKSGGRPAFATVENERNIRLKKLKKLDEKLAKAKTEDEFMSLILEEY